MTSESTRSERNQDQDMSYSEKHCLVFFDLELSFTTITQLSAVCHHGEFNRYTIPHDKFKYDKRVTKYCTKVTAKVDPADGRKKLFQTEEQVFLPTVYCKEGLRDFVIWLSEMKKISGADNLSLLSWSMEDHGKLLQSFEHRLLLGIYGKRLDAQKIVKIVINPAQTNLKHVFDLMLKGEKFTWHDALDDSKAMFKIYEEVKRKHNLDDASMMQLSTPFDPERDQLVDNVLNSVLNLVLEVSGPGWLDKTIERALN